MKSTLWQDPGTWSAIIAVVALIFSQFPPLWTLFKKFEINISIPQQLALWHYLGYLQITLTVNIDNTGGQPAYIHHIDALIVDEAGKVWLLPAQVYQPRQTPQLQNGAMMEYLLPRVAIKPDESWNETVRCYRLPTEAEEIENNKVISAVVSGMHDVFPTNLYERSHKEASAEAVAQAKALFDKNFDLHTGPYRLLVAAISDKNALLGVSGYEFSVYENHIHALESHKDYYRYGDGIIGPVFGAFTQAWVKVRDIEDKKLARDLYTRHARPVEQL